MSDMTVWLTAREAASHLHISLSLLRRLIKRGQLPVYRVGRAVRIRMSDLDAVMQKGAAS